jgi:hypothetical protein
MEHNGTSMDQGFYFFGQFCGFKRLTKLSNFFTNLFFKFTLQEQKNSKCFCCNCAKNLPQTNCWFRPLMHGHDGL